MSGGAKTIGFGVPDEIDPHHFAIIIPAIRGADVSIVENFGLRGGSHGLPESVERCRLGRSIWNAIADDVKRVLNERLKEKKVGTSRWHSGENKVERLLGREVCLLAWAVEAADKDLTPIAVRNWIALKPEERWWLFSMAVGLSGTAEDADIGWRKAIRIALTEAPASAGEERGTKGRKPARATPAAERPLLPLFD